MFIGRKNELECLNERYVQNKFEFFTIRGRRRVGKTTLLREFCKGKNAIYFVAQEQTKKASLEKLSTTITNHFGKTQLTYNSFEAAFKDVFEASLKERLILIIDEFPYLANAEKPIMSLLQNLIDYYHQQSKMFLILCGSSISFMENKVLAYKAPLYGRSTGQLKIEPFMFNTAQKYFKNYSKTDQILAYAVFGGIPAYLTLTDAKKPIKQNIIENFLKKQSYLFEEPTTLLKQEFREPALYSSIIEAVATGASKLNDIATQIDDSTAKTANYLKNLLELQIVTKQTPITQKPSARKTIYRLNDNLFKFWYRFISPNLSIIQFGDGDNLYQNLIEPYLSEYVGTIFEDICKEYLLLNINNKDNIPFFFNQIGRWWGTNPQTKTQEEIDLVALSSEKRKAFFIECKWQNEKPGLKVFDELKRKSNLLDQFKQKHYAIFSKSGFRNELLDYASNNHDLYLYDLGDLCSLEDLS